MPHLLVFSNDPLKAYVEKGEIKERYYNPGDFFDRVTIFTPCDEDVSPDQVGGIAGSAEVAVVPVGSMKNLKKLCAISREERRVVDLARSFKPDIIRAFNPRFEGRFAVAAGKALGVPSVISLHADFSRRRLFRVEGFSCAKSLLYSMVFRFYTEKQGYSRADAVIGAYAFTLRYFENFPVRRREVIYNKVYAPPHSGVAKPKDFTIISVGRHIPGKDPRPLIRALSGTPYRLILIGQGPLTRASQDLAKKLKIASQVEFIPSVPNRDILPWYQGAHVFSMAMLYGGTSIPMLEAMACRLPLVLARPLWEEAPEAIGEDALLVEHTPEAFREAFRKLQENPEYARELGEKAWNRFWPLRGEEMERREAELYRDLLQGF